VLALFGAGAQFGVLLPFSRDMESEADHIGLIYMARAGFDPANAVALWQRMETRDKGSQVPEYVSDHPSDATRIKNLEKWMPEAEKVYQQTLEKQ
jgi:predicted Zn-dependent protease